MTEWLCGWPRTPIPLVAALTPSATQHDGVLVETP
jgi:hypothetical protein